MTEYNTYCISCGAPIGRSDDKEEDLCADCTHEEQPLDSSFGGDPVALDFTEKFVPRLRREQVPLENYIQDTVYENTEDGEEEPEGN